MKIKIKCPNCETEFETDHPFRILGSLGGKSLAQKITKEQRKEWSSRGGRNKKGWRKQEDKNL